MKLKTLLLLPAIIIAFAFSCEDTSCCNDDSENPLTGKWVYFRYDYSIGGPTIKTEIPIVPSQYIHFGASKFFTSNIEGFDEYSFYTIPYHPANEPDKILFFKQEPSDNFSNPDLTMVYYLSGQELYLNNPGCIEGCAYGFKKISGEN